jgi:hypothetical protein
MTRMVVMTIWLIFGGSSFDFVPQTPAASFLTQGIGYVWGFALLGGIGALVFTTLRDRDGRGQFAEYDRLLHEHGSTSIGWMARWQSRQKHVVGEIVIGSPRPARSPESHVAERPTAVNRRGARIGHGPIRYAEAAGMCASSPGDRRSWSDASRCPHRASPLGMARPISR